MRRFDLGDRVRVDIPYEDDPDYRLHRSEGMVIRVIKDKAGATTGDERDSVLYRVRLDSGRIVDLRWRDLRPSK